MATQQQQDGTEAVLKEKIAQVKAQVGQDMDIRIDEARFAPKFQVWIDSYERDVILFKEALSEESAPEPLRRLLAGGLMYLIKQIDLIPDSYKPVGIIDDCMVLRVIADLGGEHLGELDPKHMKALFKLANDAETIRQFLGESYRDLENYVRLLPDKPVRGITGAAVASQKSVRDELLKAVAEEMKTFEAKSIEDGPRAERELHSYLKTKLTPTK
jgi:uncharacterized membrane protein YkvA (DUF1232 family)